MPVWEQFATDQFDKLFPDGYLILFPPVDWDCIVVSHIGCLGVTGVFKLSVV